MNTPQQELPEPKIKNPLSFRVVKKKEKEKKARQYLDSILESIFVKEYFKKNNKI